MKKQVFYVLDDGSKFENFFEANNARCEFIFRKRISQLSMGKNFVDALLNNLDELEDIISEYKSEIQFTEKDCIDDKILEVLR